MKEKHNTYMLTINTPDGEINVPIQHKVVDENNENMWTTISVSINEQEVSLEAETTAEVLIKLAKSLPSGWSMKSCLSCRYGHFCPTGNADNELFCVTEFEPKKISDLWHVTEDNEERRRRSRQLFNICNQYMPQVKGYFTYSDYSALVK